MKRLLLVLALVAILLPGCETAKQVFGNVTNGSLGSAEIARGLKEALRVGTDTATKHLSLVNGFFADDMIKILMPPEAQKVENTLRQFGMGKTVDKAVLSMNRAAEDASKYVGSILWNAITSMTISDAIGILRGDDFAATEYLKRSTTQQLTTAFRPIIERSLGNVDATKHWNEVFTVYNKFSRNPVNTDLPAYVTDKALAGLFYHIGLQEQQIRKNPVARVTDILKRVFGS